jgi:two-component system response regulator NreC
LLHRWILGSTEFLRITGDIEVHEASDGAEAVAKALKLRPDVVILDLNMPVMSGYEAAAKLRRLSPEIPILFFSTQSRTQLAADARSIGVQGFVNKTDANKALLQAVDEVVVNKGTFFPDSSKEVLTR